MSFKFEKLSINKRSKTLIKDLSLTAEQDKVLSMQFKDKKSLKAFSKTLLAKRKPSKGKIFINEENLTTATFRDRGIAYIAPFSLWIGFIPSRLRIVFNCLKNARFLYDSSKKYIHARYEFLLREMSENNKHRYDVISYSQKLMKEFIESTIQINKDWSDEYLTQIADFHKEQLHDIFKDQNPILFETVLSFIKNKDESLILAARLTFLQALWDKIEYIKNIEYSCNCFKIVKTKKIKDKIFNFEDIKTLSKKFSNLLNAEILYTRYAILKNKRQALQYKLSLKKEFTNNKNKEISYKKFVKFNTPEFKLWDDLRNDQWSIFTEKQDQLITKILPDDALTIKSKIIELAHNLHNLLLDNMENNIKNVFVNLEAKTYKKNIKNIWTQALDYSSNIMKKLEIRMNLLSLTKNLSGFDQIKMKILYAVLKHKQLVFFYNTFDNLTQNEILELSIIIANIQNEYKDINFVVTTNNFEKIRSISSQFIIINKDGTNFANSLMENANAPNTLSNYKLINGKSANIFVTKVKKIPFMWNDINISSFNTGIKMDQIIKVAINPQNVSFLHQENYVKALNGRVKKVKKLGSFNLVYFKVNNLENKIIKIIVSNYVDVTEQTTIYLLKNSVYLYDEQDKLLDVF